jgi:hypothetical protein
VPARPAVARAKAGCLFTVVPCNLSFGICHLFDIWILTFIRTAETAENFLCALCLCAFSLF